MRGHVGRHPMMVTRIYSFPPALYGAVSLNRDIWAMDNAKRTKK